MHKSERSTRLQADARKYEPEFPDELYVTHQSAVLDINDAGASSDRDFPPDPCPGHRFAAVSAVDKVKG